MKIKNLLNSVVLLAITLAAPHMSAGNIDLQTARATANNYLKQHASGSSRLRNAALTDLKLAHAQASKVQTGTHAYYAFNITGGGFVIVSGEDRAAQVLGYSDTGNLDWNHLPEGLKALLQGYTEQIEYLQSHPSYIVAPSINESSDKSVQPLIKSHWGQEEPYDWQCPVYQGEYCVVGCVATAMAQVMYYWQYPASSPALNSYYCYDISQTIPSLPATTFNYNNMLLSYCHWDYSTSQLVQDTYTDAQAQEVAKLSRYCGQAVQMGYSPEGSGAYTSSQLSAMKKFGFSSNARDEMRDSWWGTSYYTTAEWEAMIKEELDQRRPILYSASDPAAGGHAFICDGYDTEGKFHFNFGWYGTCDGWYVSTALNMTHRDGDQLRFNSNHEMLLGVVPPTYCIITADGLEASQGLLVLGEDVTIQAQNVSINTTNANISLISTLNNTEGRRMATSEAAHITTADFTQGSTVNMTLTLPATLEQGSYEVQFHYFTGNPRMSTRINCDADQLYVMGHVAKYGSPFDILDVSAITDALLLGTHPALTIQDASMLIDALLLGQQ